MIVNVNKFSQVSLLQWRPYAHDLLHPQSSTALIRIMIVHLLFSAIIWPMCLAKICKSTPQSPTWPCVADWRALNASVDGRLLKPPPPAAVCHPSQPTYDADVCNATNWTDATTYADDPLGIINPNWSKDSCLPQPEYPCMSDGFPVYVINATTSQHVAAAVKFASKHSVRLNVKGSGHDYLGRYVKSSKII